MRTIVISGSASGIGLACKEKLEALGDRVIGIDILDADIIADLSNREGRDHAVAQALALSGDEIDGVILKSVTLLPDIGKLQLKGGNSEMELIFELALHSVCSLTKLYRGEI